MGQNKRTADGLWDILCEVESKAAGLLNTVLNDFEEPFRRAYECGVEVVTLPSKRKHQRDLLAGGLFLKRSLTDLRSIWLLCRTGYSSQAACISAALFENSLVSSCVVGNTELAEEALSAENGDIPWKPKQLSKMYAAETEGSWQQIYASYKWLCKLKHPHTTYAVHDSRATRREDKREYVIMAFPDFRPENHSTLTTIMTTSLSRVLGAIERFYQFLDVEVQDVRSVKFKEKLDSVAPLLEAAYLKHFKNDLPVTVSPSEIK